MSSLLLPKRIAWQKRWLRWLLFLGVWLIIGLSFASQLYLFYGRTKMPMPWKSALTWEVTRWSLWAVISPLILRLARRFPLRGNKLRSLLFHVFVSIFLSLGHLMLFALAIAYLTGVIPPEKALLQKIAEYFSDVVTSFQFAFALDFHVGIIVYWVIFVAAYAFDYHRRASQLEAQLAQAQLQALKMQLHPHFLFNTLNSISALLHKDIEAADEMIGQLGDFLRLTLENSGVQEVRLKDELEFLKCYLEIERVRFQNRLTAEYQIEPGTLDARVPNLILQPIVENAIRHAIAPRAAPGKLEIQARHQNGKLQLQVSDDGPGLPASGSNEGVFKEGIGIANTRARLRQLYGADYRFELANAPQGGLMVTLEIPFKTAGIHSTSDEDNSDGGHAEHKDIDS